MLMSTLTALLSKDSNTPYNLTKEKYKQSNICFEAFWSQVSNFLKRLLYCLFSESLQAKIRNYSEEPVYISVLAKLADCVGTQSCVSTGSAMVMHMPYHATELVYCLQRNFTYGHVYLTHNKASG